MHPCLMETVGGPHEMPRGALKSDKHDILSLPDCGIDGNKPAGADDHVLSTCHHMRLRSIAHCLHEHTRLVTGSRENTSG